MMPVRSKIESRYQQLHSSLTFFNLRERNTFLTAIGAFSPIRQFADRLKQESVNAGNYEEFVILSTWRKR